MPVRPDAKRMTIIDRYLGRTAQIVIGIWVFMFVVTRIKYGYAGYVAAQVKLPADLLCKKDCDEKPHWRRSNPEVCDELDSVSSWTPYSKGIDSAFEHIYLCGVVECSAVLDSATHSLGWFGAYLVFGGVLAAICGVFLYVILTRLLVHAGRIEYQKLPETPMIVIDDTVDRSRRKTTGSSSGNNQRWPTLAAPRNAGALQWPASEEN